jgi:hypothetical protein
MRFVLTLAVTVLLYGISVHAQGVEESLPDKPQPKWREARAASPPGDGWRFAQEQKPPAQEPDAPKPQDPAQAPAPTAKVIRSEHRVWDKQNAWLFAGVGASRALDFASTRNARRRGLNEALLNNEIVDNKPAFAAIEAAGTAASIGISYLFHRTNHHKLERWTSIVHIGVSTFGAARNYCLKTPHNTTPVP